MIHYYHCCKVGEWKRIRDEHLATLEAAGYDGAIHVNEVEPGVMEDATLRGLWNYAHLVPPETPVFYAHGKGSFRPAPAQEEWRRAMDDWLAAGWKDRVVELQRADISAWHWFPPDTAQIPEFFRPVWLNLRTLPYGFCTGNFWWATAGYIAGLPEPGPLPHSWMRWLNESWVGKDSPAVKAKHPPEWPRAQQLLET